MIGRRNVSIEIAEQIVELGHQISDHHQTATRREVVTGLGTFVRVHFRYRSARTRFAIRSRNEITERPVSLHVSPFSVPRSNNTGGGRGHESVSKRTSYPEIN